MYLSIKSEEGINVNGHFPEQMVIIGDNGFPELFLDILEFFRHASITGASHALWVSGWDYDSTELYVQSDNDYVRVEEGEVMMESLADRYRNLTTQAFPESGVSPLAHQEMAEDFLTKYPFIFITTVSPQFLNGFPLEKIFIFRNDGTLLCANDIPMVKKLVEEGDLPGQLWMQGLLIPNEE